MMAATDVIHEPVLRLLGEQIGPGVVVTVDRDPQFPGRVVAKALLPNKQGGFAWVIPGRVMAFGSLEQIAWLRDVFCDAALEFFTRPDGTTGDVA